MKTDPKIADELEHKLRQVFKPDDGTDIITWLEDNVKQIPFSPMPAGFRIKHTPWLAEPLRACVDIEKRHIHIIAPIQSGKSLAGELLSCYIIARQPAPTLYLNDTDDNAYDWIQSRLRVLWENTPEVMKKLAKGEEKSKSDTVQTKDMTFWCLGAFNPKNLQRRSIRWIVADETWQYPKGHLAEASARVESFGWLGKKIFMSQGGYQGDETEEFWNMTTKSVWSFRCPVCDYGQQFKWEQVKLPEDYVDFDGGYNYDKIRKHTTYECEGCKHLFPDNIESRNNMNDRGYYAITNPSAADYNVGYTWNCLAVRSWGRSAEAYLRAKTILDVSGDSSPMRIFKQKQLALFWSDVPDQVDILSTVGDYKEGQEWEDEHLIDPATRKVHKDKTLKNQIPTRFMTVDCQRTGFYYVIRSWALNGESRLLRKGFVSTWNDLVSVANAHKIFKSLVYVDCGDQFDDVIRQCGVNGWTALRGDQRSEFPWRIKTSNGYKTVNKTYAPARLVNAGTGVVRVHHFSNLALKDQLSRLRKTGKHTCPVDVGDDYLLQMESEVRVMETNGKPIWKVVGKRANHLWDCEVMQLVAAQAFGLLGIPKDKQIEDNNQQESADSQPSS